MIVMGWDGEEEEKMAGTRSSIQVGGRTLRVWVRKKVENFVIMGLT